MSAAVAVPLSAINDQLGGVLPPSALVQHEPRHGRSRGMSVKGKNAKGRSYSIVEDRDVSIAKALMFVLKRTITESEVDEEEEVDNLVVDAEGWVGIDDVLEHPKIRALEVDLDDVQRVVANAIKARFNLRQLPNTNNSEEDPSSWEIRRIVTGANAAAKRESGAITEPIPIPVGEKLQATDSDLPEFIVYETSYQRYPLLLTAGVIAQAPGAAPFLSFQPVAGSDDQTQTQTTEVAIWIHLRSALQAKPTLSFQRTETGGTIVTTDEVPKSLWKKAVARRPDLGLLFEDGQVRKEIPAALRGKKSTRNKARKGKGAGAGGLGKRDGSGDDDDDSGTGAGSASEEQEE